MILKILALGDVVGDPGTNYLAGGRRLSGKRAEYGAHLVIVNGENSAEGNGILPSSAQSLFDSGADIITGGNHSWQRRETYDYMDDTENLIRPANYPASVPGHGYTLCDVCGTSVLVINLVGNTFMDPVASPFDTADKILAQCAGRYDIAVVDIHAEATSEKIALGWYLDGRVGAVFGTHTHVATSDARVLPGGTGYVTDLGMCGSENGVIGVDRDIIIKRFRDRLPSRNRGCTGLEAAHGALFSFDTDTGACISCESVSF